MAMLGEKELATWRRPEFAGPRRNVVFNSPYACYVMVWVIHIAQWPNGCSWFSSSLLICQFCSQTTCSARLGNKGKAMECAPSHHRRRHPLGVSSRERPWRFNEEATLACRGGLRRWRKANLQIVKRYVKVCSSSPSIFFGATTFEEVMATWLLSEEVFESLVDLAILGVYALSTFRRWTVVRVSSGVHTDMHDRVESISYVSSKSQYLWNTKRGEELDRFDLLQGVWLHQHRRTKAAAALSQVDGQFDELWSGLFLLYASVISTCTFLMWVLDYYVINLGQLHFVPQLHVILVKFSFSKCRLLGHAA